MIVLCKLILINVMIVLALRVAMSEKMLLEKLGRYFEKKVEDGYKVFDLLVCPWCSGTLQSITAHLFAYGLGIITFELSWAFVIRWILVIFGTCFIAGMSWTIYLTINQIRENNEAQAEYFKNLNQNGTEENSDQT